VKRNAERQKAYRNRQKPHLQELRALLGYREKRAEFKKNYFAIPEGVSFTPIPTVLLESEIWSTLGIYDRRFIDAIMIAHARAGGCKNGRLVLTYEQLKEKGIRGDRIRPTIERLVELKLLEVTHKGGPGDPARYRVTFLPHQIEAPNGRVSHYPPGNDWIEIELEIIDGRRHAREKRRDAHRFTSEPVPGAKCAPVDETETFSEQGEQPIDKWPKSVAATP